MQYYSKNKSIVLAALILWLFSQGALALTVSGGGETIITGGNGDPDLGNLVPVKTVFAFNATKKKGHVDGRFECLALAPSAPGSGDLSANVMYVTGIVSELERNGRKKAVMRGLARITGLGAGEDVPFEATIGAGPTGATFSLTVESLPDVVFREIVIDGRIQIER